jgi:hypothetical protein
MKSHLALTLALVVFLPTAALAQSQDEQSACMNDAFQVCGHAIPDRDRVAACLSANLNRISMPCRQVMQRYSNARTTTPARRERVYDRY